MSLLHEWPLVLFTLTVQLAVGLLVVSLAAKSLVRAEGPFLLAGFLMTAALAVSILHLGSPVKGLFSLSNLDQSWLSREILAALLFMGLWGLSYWLRRRPGTAIWMADALAWAAALAGIVLIWVMARIYMLPARPLWDHWLTAAGFFLSTLVLGASAAAVFLARPALLAVGAAAALAQIGATLNHPLNGEITSSPGGAPLAGLRIILLLGGAALLVIPLARSPAREKAPSRAVTRRRWAAGALLLLGASEMVGRMLFYAVGPLIPF